MKLLVYDSQLMVRKEAFAVKYHVYKCEDSGEEFETPALMEINLQQAMDQYRSKYNLPKVKTNQGFNPGSSNPGDANPR